MTLRNKSILKKIKYEILDELNIELQVGKGEYHQGKNMVLAGKNQRGKGKREGGKKAKKREKHKTKKKGGKERVKEKLLKNLSGELDKSYDIGRK